MIKLNQVPTHALDFNHILLEPVPNTKGHRSRSDINLDASVTPIIVANMDFIATFEMAQIYQDYNIFVAILKDYTAKEWLEHVRLLNLKTTHLIPTIGIRDFDSELNKIRQIVEAFPDIPFVSMDVPNAYLDSVVEATQKFKSEFPHIKLSVGNVVNFEGVCLLHEAGADIVKVGIGSGSACLTRRMTGVGYPQFSAIHDIYAKLMEHNMQDKVQLISDGGITNGGDAIKAMAAGATYVMAGGFFAGHTETGNQFHGMSSHQSRDKRGEERATYRSSEGRSVVLKERGSIRLTLSEMLGGFRSAGTMLNVDSPYELRHTCIRANIVAQQMNRVGGVEEEH